MRPRGPAAQRPDAHKKVRWYRVTCPVCGAKPHSQCVSQDKSEHWSGKYAGPRFRRVPHPERTKAAVAKLGDDAYEAPRARPRA